MTKANLKGDVLLVGNLSNDSITTNIKSIGSTYIKKMLSSSPKNWEKIAELLEQDASKIACVLVKLTESDLQVSVLPAYRESFQRICESLSKHAHMVFIFTGILSDDFPYFHETEIRRWEEKERRLKNKREGALWKDVLENSTCRMYGGSFDEYKHDLKESVDQLQISDLRIAPYKTLVELNVSAQQFIEESFRGLLMRIYIPNDRLWAGEVDKLLTLFADYLRKIENQPITLDQNRTEKGLVYGFYSSDSSITRDQISNLLEEFSIFLKVCAEDPLKASELLKVNNISKEQLHSIITKYSKEARRLLLDIQQEREAKLLSVRHKLESELLDTMSANESKTALILINDSVAASIDNPLDILHKTGLATKGDTIIQSQTININNPQFISHVKGVIAKEINGSIEYSEQDERIIELFRSYASDLDYLELKSSLDELKDQSVSQPQRITARQKIRGFLAKHSGTIGKSVLTVLEKYVEHLLTGQ